MIDPRNIRQQSRTRAVVRFWVSILIQTIICLAVVAGMVLLFVLLDALLHPPAIDLNIQLPTL